jgi:hypothetical protein
MSGLKTLAGPMEETARVFIVRWDLKKAAGKGPV